MSDFANEFDAATGLPPDVAEYVRCRVVLRLGGATHGEVDFIMGEDFNSRPDGWRIRYEMAAAGQEAGAE